MRNTNPLSRSTKRQIRGSIAPPTGPSSISANTSGIRRSIGVSSMTSSTGSSDSGFDRSSGRLPSSRTKYDVPDSSEEEDKRNSKEVVGDEDEDEDRANGEDSRVNEKENRRAVLGARTLSRRKLQGSGSELRQSRFSTVNKRAGPIRTSVQ